MSVLQYIISENQSECVHNWAYYIMLLRSLLEHVSGNSVKISEYWTFFHFRALLDSLIRRVEFLNVDNQTIAQTWKICLLNAQKWFFRMAWHFWYSKISWKQPRHEFSVKISDCWVFRMCLATRHLAIAYLILHKKSTLSSR